MRRMRLGALVAVAASFVAVTLAMTRPAAAGTLGEDQMSARQACRAALAREESGKTMHFSRTPCDKAFLSGMPEDMRDDVAAMMSPAARPSLDDLAIATLMTD